MKIDYKKENKDLYLPKRKPMLIEIPEMQFTTVEGKGDPNEEDGEYQKALGVLYAVQYTIKMSKMRETIPYGYFDYVVPPLEGLWWLDNNEKIPHKDKSKYKWISMIRLPEFVDRKTFNLACSEVQSKKKINTENVKLFKFKEGLCVQCMHIGSYDDEPKTLELIENFIKEQNLKNDISDKRKHHEIYLSDPRKIDTDKLKTVLRIPVRK